MARWLVDTAAKCFASAALPRRSAIHCRARRALLIVSSVVNVFEQTMKSVVAGSALSMTSAIWQPSMFETKRTARSRLRNRASASTAITGPRSEPPMPMLTMVRNGLPVLPATAPECTPRTKASSLARSARTSSMMLRPSTASGRSSARRSAVCNAGRFSVLLTRWPLSSAWMRPLRSAFAARSTRSSRARESSLWRV